MSITDRSKPFFRVRVENAVCPHTAKATLIEWSMERWFRPEPPWVFRVYKSRRLDGDDWTLVATVSNQGFAWDQTKNSYGFGLINHYRVEVDVKDGDGVKTFRSDPVLAGNNLSNRDWRMIRRRVNQELKLQRSPQGVGVRGWLLRYPLFGEMAEGADPNTGEALTTVGGDDFGTGVAGGYWGPIEAWVIFPNADQRLVKVSEQGPITNVVRTAQVLASPPFRENDLWVNGMTDERFRVMGQTITTYEIRGIPVIQNAQLKLLPSSHDLYRIPVPMQV